MVSSLSYLLALAAQLLLINCYDLAKVRFGVAESQGEVYRRLIEPMPQYIAEASICASSQVHLTLGGSGPQSITVSWVNSDILSSSNVMFGTDASKLTSTAKGTGASYTQLLAPLASHLVTPKMGAPEATAATILALANTSTFAYDRGTGKKWANYKNVRTYVPGPISYSNPYAYYDSPIIHTTVLTGLVAGMTYYYQPAGACKVYSFTMTQAANTYPFKAALAADLGTTAVSAMSVAILAAMKASVVIYTGDFSYADGWTPIWDVFGLMMEPLASAVPLLTTGGNHEFFGENWQSYAARYPTNSQDSGSPNFCYHGREVGPMNIISLCSYGAVNFAGLNTGANSLQFQWLTNYLTTIDRTRTPWLMVQFHVPMYCTNTGHYMTGEIFRRQYEPLFYKYGVDIVMNGHVHAYERSYPVYNNTVNPCGITHLVLGDGGNYENAYVPWIDPVKPWSAFREASFGVASLTVLSATQANFTWHRHACGSLSMGPPNYGQNFSKSCVTPLDNSANVALSVDSYIMTKPSKASCPNRYISGVVAPAPTSGLTEQSSSDYLQKEDVADGARILPESAPRVLFEVAETQGEVYRRLIEPMPQYIVEASICGSSQVHLTLGGSGPQSITVSWVNSDILSSSNVMFGTDASKLTSTAKGTGASYTQNLYPTSTNLVTPKMGAPQGIAAAIVALANTSTFAYDRGTGRKWANYKNVRSFVPGPLSYSNPYAYYDSPIIHTAVLTGLVAGMTYYYKPAGASKVFSFTMIQAVNTYPFKAALVADLGTTAVSVMSVAILAAMKANVVIVTGGLAYADGWPIIWDGFGLMIEPLACAVPLLTVGGNHELSNENWQSYAARYPTNSQDSGSPNFCYHGREVGPMNIISLCSYGAANFAGLNTGANSLQFQWLTNYLATVDRTRTPWLMVQFSVPMYCTSNAHYKEGEIFRRQYEPLLYKYGVDIVMNGNVHAYERSFPVYNNTVNPCGITHLVLGDGGNYENADVPWIDPVKPWSAFREASFGVASLNVLSATQANFTWHRHACGSLSMGPPNYGQNFSKSCVTPLDNSANVALSVDSYFMTKPSKASCPNRYTTSVPTSAPTSAPSSTPTTAGTTAPTSSVRSTPTSAVTTAPTSAPRSTPTLAVTSAPPSSARSTPTSVVTTAPSAATLTPTSAPVAALGQSSLIEGSCFAGTETVELESGTLKYISDVKVGDSVLAATSSGKTTYSEVVYLPHKYNTQQTDFVQITTEGSRDLKMTKNHILPCGVCGSSAFHPLPLISAAQINVGDCVLTVSGEERVRAVEITRGVGVYTIVTKQEFVVVNGIIASPFGVNHMMANLYYNMHRFVYSVAPRLLESSLLQSVNEGLGVLTPLFGSL